MMECLLKSGDYDIYEQYTITDYDGYNVLALLVNLNYENSIIKLFEYLNLISDKNLKNKYLIRKGNFYIFIFKYIYVYVVIYMYMYASIFIQISIFFR